MNSLLVFSTVCIAFASAAGSLGGYQLGGYSGGVQHIQYVQAQPHIQYQRPQIVHHSTYSQPIQTQQLVQVPYTVASPMRQIVQSQPSSYSYSYNSGIRRGVSSANNVQYVSYANSHPVQTTQVLQPTIGLGGLSAGGGQYVLSGAGHPGSIGTLGNTLGSTQYIRYE